MSKRIYHPCHKLSVPSAKIYWCRHCMQMFEDAISRWKHSKTCRGSQGFKQKNQDGQVVQMYVKSDPVSYTSNIVPGQIVYHKPIVKKTSAELKCIICHTRFRSLHDMREHVKYPCQRNYSVKFEDSSDSDEDTSASLKIQRVEELNNSSALSVLAEASKHVESLAQGAPVSKQVHNSVHNRLSEHSTQQFSSSAKSSNNFSSGEEIFEAFPRPQVRPELGTVILVIQQESGQENNPSSLNLPAIQNCVKEIIQQLSFGQTIEVCGTEYVVGYQGTIWPILPTNTADSQSVTESSSDQINRTCLPELQLHLNSRHILINQLEKTTESVLGEDKIQPIVDNNIFAEDEILTIEEIVPLQDDVNYISPLHNVSGVEIAGDNHVRQNNKCNDEQEIYIDIAQNLHDYQERQPTESTHIVPSESSARNLLNSISNISTTTAGLHLMQTSAVCTAAELAQHNGSARANLVKTIEANLAKGLCTGNRPSFIVTQIENLFSQPQIEGLRSPTQVDVIEIPQVQNIIEVQAPELLDRLLQSCIHKV